MVTVGFKGLSGRNCIPNWLGKLNYSTLQISLLGSVATLLWRGERVD